MKKKRSTQSSAIEKKKKKKTSTMRKTLDLSWSGLGLPLAALVAAHVCLLVWLFFANSKNAAEAKRRTGKKD